MGYYSHRRRGVSFNQLVWMGIIGLGASGLLLVTNDATFVKSQASRVSGDQAAIMCRCECQGEAGQPLCAAAEVKACRVGQLYSFVTDLTSCVALEGSACTPEGSPVTGNLTKCQAAQIPN